MNPFSLLRCQVVFGLLVGVTLGQGCTVDEKPSSQRVRATHPTLPNSAPSSTPNSAPSHRDAQPRPSANAQTQGATPAATLLCKARGKPGHYSLGTHHGEFVSHVLRALGDDLYLLVASRPNARVTLLRFKRDGSGKATLGHLPSMGSPEGLWLTPEWAYTTVKRALWRFAIAGGDATLLTKEFSRPIAIMGAHVYGSRCGKADKTDTLVRVGLGGDNLEELAKVARKSQECDYRGLALNETKALLSDWPGRRLLSVSLADGAVRELAVAHAFPREIVISPLGIDFATSKGLYRVTGEGTAATQLASIGSTPFMDLGLDQTHYWVFQGEPYEPSESIWRLPRSGGKATKVWTFANRGAELGTGIDAIAVDEQCVYYSMHAKDGESFTVYARAKPE